VSISSPQAGQLLRDAYRAFNARDIEAAVALMHADIDWPNAWEGGRVLGREAVADYWRRQFESISSRVEPEEFEHAANGEITVLVRQSVNDARTGEGLSEGFVRHRYRFSDGLIVRMDVLDVAAGDSGED
jgi:ketosteroid isomerase-like protein